MWMYLVDSCGQIGCRDSGQLHAAIVVSNLRLILCTAIPVVRLLTYFHTMTEITSGRKK